MGGWGGSLADERARACKTEPRSTTEGPSSSGGTLLDVGGPVLQKEMNLLLLYAVLAESGSLCSKDGQV